MNTIDANSSLEMECKGPVGGQRERMAGMFMTSVQGLHRGLRWQETVQWPRQRVTGAQSSKCKHGDEVERTAFSHLYTSLISNPQDLCRGKRGE